MSEGQTKANKSKGDPYEYQPTANEQAVLAILTDPFRWQATVTKICEEVGISRNMYYKMHNKPEFKALYHALTMDALKAKSAQLMNMGIREAARGGKAGYPYWRDLMKMAGKLDADEGLKGKLASGTITLRFVDPLEEPEDEDDD